MTHDQINQLVSEGALIKRRDGKPFVVKSGASEDTRLLRRISDLIEKLLAKPSPDVPAQPAPIVKPPDVIVKPAQITFAPVTKWRFELKKDLQGRTTEIIATAMKE